MENYTILHLHSDMSSGTTNIDSVTKFEEYINRAVELGMTSMAFTEHGNIYSWVKKKQTCDKKGIKYIHGVEAYVTKTLDEKVRDNYHVCMYALNLEGVRELNKLVSISNGQDHKYYVPRISYDELKSTSDNIAISTSCIGGILGGSDESLKLDYIDFLTANRGRCFLEIGHHNTDRQKEHNKYIYDIHKATGVRMILGTDTHSLNEKHIIGREVLQKAKNIYFENERGWDLSLKTYEELINCMGMQGVILKEDYIKAIKNTNVLADMVDDFELDYTYKYPKLWRNPLETLTEKIVDGIKRRGVDKFSNKSEYMDRIQYELSVYEHNKAIDFMLLMEDIIDWCNHNDVQVGYGRGSCNGSVIAWLLGITEMDSIKHGLSFERFMNSERVSLADIDTDFPPSRREDVKDYIFSKTGLHCCDIITFNTIALKGAIRDVGRALDMKLSEVDDICERVEMEESVLREQYKKLFEYVDIINGTIVSVGSHPCGTVVCDRDVEYEFGTFSTSTSKYPISQINMKEIDGLNYVKLDLLGLDSIQLINEVCKLAGIDRLTPDNVDVEDVDVWDSIRDDTTQIFQWEGNTGNAYIKKLLSNETIANFKKINSNVKRIDLLSIGNSAIRPAGSSYRDELGGGMFRDSGSSALNEFLSNTYSFLVFQEQIISFLNIYCGYTMGEADVVRRGFAKKTGTEQHIPRIKDGFIKTMTEKYGQTKCEAEDTIVAFLKVIEDASSYLFSLNHSQPYSYTGYIAGYLRHYYPLEFLTVAMNINEGNEDKTSKLIEYATNIGISIKSPQFRYSKGEYFFDKSTNSIYKGIGSIKFLNASVGNDLYKLRDNEYSNFLELLSAIKESVSINSKQLDLLIRIGFFDEFGSVKYLSAVVEVFNNLSGKKNISKDKIEVLGLSCVDMTKYCTETAKQYKVVDGDGLILDVIKGLDTTEYPINILAAYKQDVLGYIDVVDESYSYDVLLVADIISNKYGTPFINAYRIKDGVSNTLKVDKRFYMENPIAKNDIIQIVDLKEQYKKRKVDGRFINTDEIEYIITKYRKIKY